MTIETARTKFSSKNRSKDAPHKNLPALRLPSKLTVLPSNLSTYIREVNAFPYLTAEEERDYIQSWTRHRSMEAANMLTLSHLRLVVKIALMYRGYGLPVLDLIQEGNVGLIEAIKRFKVSMENRLSTYATYWIKAYIHEYILSSWSLVKVGRSRDQKKLFFGLRKAKESLGYKSHVLGETEIKKIAEHMDVGEKEVRSMEQRLLERDLSLSVPRTNQEGETTTLEDRLAGEEEIADTLTVHDERKWKHHLLGEAMKTLNDRERDIFCQRHLKDPKATLDSLAKNYHVSIERVRQIDQRAYKKVGDFVMRTAKERRLVADTPCLKK